MKKRLVTVVLSFCLMVFGLVGLASPASAAPAFQMPFPCGEVWRASTYSGHTAIDWNRYPSDNYSPVVASASGVASLKEEPGYGGHMVVIDHGGGWKTAYAHLQQDGRATGQVSAGQVIGYVGSSGAATGAHLHWEQLLNDVAQTPLYANGSVITPGASADQSAPAYTSNNCTANSGSPRIATVGSGVLNVKEGSLNSVWSQVGGGTQVKLSPNRIASLNANGELYVKEGALNAPWVMVSNGVDAFDVTDNRVGILSGGVLSIKEGALNVPWFPIGSGSAFSMSTNRIALYDQGNNLVVKEGALNAYWQGVAGAVDAFDVTDNRVGILAGGVLSIKQGALNAPWSAVGGGVSFELSSNRIASLNASGELYVKEGALNTPWNMVSNGVSAFNVTDNRVGMLAGDNLSVKEGSLNAPWSYVGNGLVNFDMS